MSSPVALFQGYRSALGTGMSTAVEGTSTTRKANTEVVCSVSESSEELATTLSINASMSARGVMGSVNAKTNFMSSLNTATNDIYVSVRSKHELGTESMTDVKFQSDIVVPTEVAQVNDFVKSYGDAFVSSLTIGGEYIAVYAFHSSSKEERTSVKASLKAKGVYGGVAASGSMQTAMNSFLKSTTVNYTFRQFATGLSSITLPPPENFIDFALQFPDLEIDAPAVLSLSFAGYESVSGSGTAFNKVRQNRRYFIGQGGSDTGLAGSLSTLSEIKNQIDWISDVYTHYGGYDDSVLTANLAAVNSDIQAIRDQTETFILTATSDIEPLTLNSIVNGTPQLRFTLQWTPRWGGGGGGIFDDIDMTTYFSRKTRISAISLRTGNHVDQIRTTYTCTVNGEEQATTKTHGHGGGSERGTLQLLDKQFVSEVSGKSGSRLDKINFKSSGGLTLGGGGSGGGSFSWAPPSGTFVIGFKGRSGSEIDAIQVGYANFEPATWEPVN